MSRVDAVMEDTHFNAFVSWLSSRFCCLPVPRASVSVNLSGPFSSVEVSQSFSFRQAFAVI